MSHEAFEGSAIQSLDVSVPEETFASGATSHTPGFPFANLQGLSTVVSPVPRSYYLDKDHAYFGLFLLLFG